MERSLATSSRTSPRNSHFHVDPEAKLDHTVDVHTNIAALKADLAKIPNVLTDPALDVGILTFTLASPML
jgi:small conductance mechanosensitive channel